MLYQSIKLTNSIWVLAEMRVQTGNPNYTVNGNKERSRVLKGLLKVCEETSKVPLEHTHTHKSIKTRGCAGGDSSSRA